MGEMGLLMLMLLVIHLSILISYIILTLKLDRIEKKMDRVEKSNQLLITEEDIMSFPVDCKIRKEANI
jgi:uncharacterized protein YoxC